MMRGALICTVAVWACGGAPAGPVRESGAPAGQGARVTLPPDQFEGVPGWLGFVARPQDQRARGWTPAHPNAGVVIIDAEAWEGKAGAVRALAREGAVALAPVGIAKMPYGCDGNERVMAGFRTPRPLVEQLVWIVPETAAAATAVAVPVRELAAMTTTALERRWSVGEHAVVVALDPAERRRGRLAVWDRTAAVFELPFEQPEMDGSAPGPIDLTKELELGVPYVEGAFRLGPELGLIVLRTLTHEGVRFDVLAQRGGTLARAGDQYISLCAF